MYQQINNTPTQRDLQRIFWREDPYKPLKVYQLNTVTYRTASAAWLATRCLHQLGIEGETKYPKASVIIQRNFYVDDLLTGCDNVEEALILRQRIIQLLKKGQLELHKWYSNSSQVLKGVDSTKQEPRRILNQTGDLNVKIGLLWNPELEPLQLRY